MLNGADSFTDTGENNYSYEVFGDLNMSASIYTSNNCLLATFPQELQDAIGKRKVKYDSVYDQKNEENLKTTNDKLWLFSSNEVADTISHIDYNHPLEGSVYEKFKGTGDGYNANEVRRAFRVDSMNGNSAGEKYSPWLRSSYGNSSGLALNLDDNGCVRCDHACYAFYGVSVGFTLKK